MAQKPSSARSFARARGIPESNLRAWTQRLNTLNLSPTAVAFFTSEEGLRLLHLILCAAVYVIVVRLNAGPRRVCEFLELSTLSSLVTSSHGTIAAFSERMLDRVIELGNTEEDRLAKGASPKDITLSPDETYHKGAPVLISIEPVSGYSVVEKVASNCESVTWKVATSNFLEKVPFRVIQQTHDGSKALKNYTEKGLSAHLSPDLMHLMAPLHRAISRPLGKQVQTAEVRLEATREQVAAREAAKAADKTYVPGVPGLAYDIWIKQAENDVKQAEESRRSAIENLDSARTLINSLSTDYHPFDLKTGALRSASQLEASLTATFDQLSELATKTVLTDKSKQALWSARKAAIEPMVKTLTFYHEQQTLRLAQADLHEPSRQAMVAHWLPGEYLLMAASKETDSAKRYELKERGEELLASLADADSVVMALAQSERSRLAEVVKSCLDVFQRSSSCTEGRNGQVELQHHSLRGLPPKRLEAQRVLHNFHIKRPDGTTAAERLFGQKPRSLYEYVVEHLTPLGFPARRRQRVMPRPFWSEPVAGDEG